MLGFNHPIKEYYFPSVVYRFPCLPTHYFGLKFNLFIYLTSLYYTFSAAWDYSAFVRAYALYLEERLECSRTLGCDIESDHILVGIFTSSFVNYVFYFY